MERIPYALAEGRIYGIVLRFFEIYFKFISCVVIHLSLSTLLLFTAAQINSSL